MGGYIKKVHQCTMILGDRQKMLLRKDTQCALVARHCAPAQCCRTRNESMHLSKLSSSFPTFTHAYSHSTFTRYDEKISSAPFLRGIAHAVLSPRSESMSSPNSLPRSCVHQQQKARIPPLLLSPPLFPFIPLIARVLAHA